MAATTKEATNIEPEGEAKGRARGYEGKGGRPGNVPLEDGQLRGVDHDGQPITGTHGGPRGDTFGSERPINEDGAERASSPPGDANADPEAQETTSKGLRAPAGDRAGRPTRAKER